MTIKKMRYEEMELLEGMRNCFKYCGEDFEGTVRMVSNARDREPEEVIETLKRLAKEFAETAQYQKIRAEIPQEFPF